MNELIISLPQPLENAINRLFDDFDLPKLGGMSGLRGWTSISTFQRCEFEWKKSFFEKTRERESSTALDVGSGAHLWLAVYYSSIFDPAYPIKVQDLKRLLLERGGSLEILDEVDRITSNYFAWYRADYLTPLAVEVLAEDRDLGASCRYDLIAKVDKKNDLVPMGIYNIEHKTRSVFYVNDLHSWRNDGEVLGQHALWKSSGMEDRFGELSGTIVNFIGKQKKSPKCHRTPVIFDPRTVEDHRKSLERWFARMTQATSTNFFERSRSGCKGREFGICPYYDECGGDGL